MTTATEWRPDPSPIAAELNELVSLSASLEGRLTAIAAHIADRIPEDRAEAVEKFMTKRIEKVITALNSIHRDLQMMPEHDGDD